MITEEHLKQLINDLTPKDTQHEFVIYTGKSFVRHLATQLFNGSYTFSQLLSLFRTGVVSGANGSYIIKTAFI